MNPQLALVLTTIRMFMTASESAAACDRPWAALSGGCGKTPVRLALERNGAGKSLETESPDA